MDTSFKDYSELYKWISEGKPMEANGHKIKYGDDGYFSMIGCDLSDFRKVFEKKKVVLYRYTYEVPCYGTGKQENTISQSLWMSGEFNLSNKVVKTETKEIELDID